MSVVLSVDGKKLATGLNEKLGDVDLSEVKAVLEKDLELTDNAIEAVQKLHSLTDISPLKVQAVMFKLKELLTRISFCIKELRLLNVKQSLSLKKIQNFAGDNWRQSKFLYAISNISATMFQAKVCITKLLNINQTILDAGANLNIQDVQNMDNQTIQINWHSLKNTNNLPEALADESQFV
jgi:hypothetical protein